MPLLRCKWVDPGQRIRGALLKMLAAATLALTEFLAAARAMIWCKVFRLERARNIACGRFCTQPSSTGDLAIRPFTSKRCSRSAQFCLTWATSRICHRERSNALSMSLSRTHISTISSALTACCGCWSGARRRSGFMAPRVSSSTSSTSFLAIVGILSIVT